MNPLDALATVATTATTVAELLKVFECPVCFSTLTRPTTVACGHTFCDACLDKALMQAPQCPMCRAPCFVTPASARRVNVVLERALQVLLPERAAAAAASSSSARNVAAEEDVPVKVPLFCINADFFIAPGSLAFLRVFEPRYLLLMRRCVEHGVPFGLQSGWGSNRGVMVTVDRVRNLPDGALLMQGTVDGRFERFSPQDTPEEEMGTFGLHHLNSRLVKDAPVTGAAAAELDALVAETKNLLKEKLAQLSKDHVRALHKLGKPQGDVSFWLLEVLDAPAPWKHDTMFLKDRVARTRRTLDALRSGVPFVREA